jgi:hypothetical protein
MDYFLVFYRFVSLITVKAFLPKLPLSVAFVMILLYDYVLTFGEKVSLPSLTRPAFI